MTEELKPCPFCGSDKLLICETTFDANVEGLAYAVSCRVRECHGGIWALGSGCFETAEEAIAAWNTRAALGESHD